MSDLLSIWCIHMVRSTKTGGMRAEQPDLARRIDPPLPVTVAEVEHAIHHEMALTLADVMDAAQNWARRDCRP